MIEMPKVREWNGKNPERIKYIQEKKNGYCLQIVKLTGDPVLVTGKKEDYTEKFCKVTQFKHFLSSLPEETVIFVEMYVEGKPATDVITALNESWESLRFAAFAMPYYKGEGLDTWDLRDVNSLLDGMGIEVPFTAYDPDVDIEHLLQFAINLGYEGWVLKESHMSGWWKLKPVKTVDAIVTQWWMGNSQFFGELGALGISVYTANGGVKSIGRVGGGFTPDERKQFTREYIIGRVIEVSYQDVQSKGKLQFPRFMRIRDDKSAEQCTEDQLGTKEDPWIQEMLDEQKRREE
jgi:ATP-dependent DNA ligase